MTNKIKLKNKPNAYMLRNIISKHANGVPLNCDESHFLEWHQKSLSNPHMDSAAEYYLKRHHHDYIIGETFLLRHEKINKNEIEKLKKRLKIMLINEKKKNVTIKFTPEQYHDFKNLNYNELIFFHGNQFLTGAPFFPGGIAPVIFFQWGNLFGVAKYIILPEEHALRSNVLIYFEDILERKLEECIHEYKDKFPHEFKNIAPLINDTLKQSPEPAPSHITPSYTLSKNKENKEKD